MDAFDAKADALAVLAAIGAPRTNLQVTTDAPGWYHPGRSGVLRLGPAVLARFGEIHPERAGILDIDGPLVGFEVLIDAVPLPRGKAGPARPLLAPRRSSRSSATSPSWWMPRSRPKADPRRQGAEKALIRSVALFDLYAGKGMPEGKKSLAIAVTLQAPDRTLTDAEIEAVSRRSWRRWSRRPAGR